MKIRQSKSYYTYLVLINLLINSAASFASSSLSYSGRLVNANGSPVTGNVNLKAELAYTNSLTTIRCIDTVSNVPLSNGVFHTKLDFDCDPSTLSKVLASIPVNESVAIRITDITDLSHPKSYSFQSLYSVPSSIVSRMALQIAQMSATDGQVLTWDNTANEWVPRNPGGNGTVTSISTGIGLAGGVIENSGTISIANQGVETILIKDSAVTSVKIEDGTITDADISSTAEIAQTKIKDLSTNLAGKENSITAGTIGQYWSWDKTWKDFSPAVRETFLGVDYQIVPTPGALGASDNLLEAFGKLEGQIIANDTAFDNSGQWSKSGSLIYYNTGNVGIGTLTPAEKLQVAGNIAVDGKLRLKDSGSNFVELKSPTTLSGTVTFTLPSALGTNGQVLVTDASGNLSWSTPSTNSSDIVDGTIVNDDISASANIAQSKILNLTTDLAAKQASDSDLTALAGLTGTGVLVRTGDGTAITRTIAGTASRLNVTDGNGVAGNPVLDISTSLLPSPLVGDAGKFLKASGANTSAWQALASGDITTALGFTPIDKSGDSITSGVFDFNTSSVVRVLSPVGTTDVANKQYVDSQVAGASNQWAQSSGNVYRTTGNVGIGTSSPSSLLEMASAAPILQIKDTDAVLHGAGHHNKISFLDSANATTGLVGFSTSAETMILYNYNDGGDLYLGNNGGPQIAIKNSGNIGIGTTTPLRKLDVQADLGQTAGEHALSYFGRLGSAASVGGLYLGYYSDGAADTGGILRSTGNLSLFLGTSDNNQAVTITNPGNVGIGTTTPSANLEINKSSNTVYNLKLKNGGGSATVAHIAGGNTGSEASLLKVTDNLETTTFFEVTDGNSYFNNGSLGVGTTTPDEKLEVDNGNIQVRSNTTMTVSGTPAGLRIFNKNSTGGSDYLNIGWISENVFGIQSADESTVRSLSLNPYGGNVGVGTTAPIHKLHVVGTGFIDDGASTVQLLSRPDSVLDVNNSTAAKRSFSIHHYTGSSLIAQWYNCPAGVCAQKMAFDTTGNMVIAGTLTQSSDRNLKKDIKPLTNSLAKISTIQGVSYNWKDETNPEKQIGLIAQEVAEVYPEVVREDKDGLLSVGYQNLIAPIIEAIKELNNKTNSSDERYKREIASLKEQNEKLQKQNELFEKRLEALEKKK